MVCGCIVDKEVCIGADSHLGMGGQLTPNQSEPEILKNGLTVVGKGAHIPANLVIERNCRIDPFVSPKDFEISGPSIKERIASGTTIWKMK
jgi:glucose-1-phosphate adenylyltransferase